MRETLPDEANVLLPPPLIFLAALVVGLLLQHVVPVRWLPASWADWIGGVLVYYLTQRFTMIVSPQCGLPH